MNNGEQKKKISKKILLEVDLTAKLLGFDTAKTATRAHRRVMKNYASPLLLGPPPGDDLLELMAHMFTEDEADAAQYLPPLLPRSAAQVAARCRRPVRETTALLDNLADNKHVLFYYGEPRKYTILPLVPGTFEMAVMTPDLSRTNHWHKRFAELFQNVWDEGYITDYVGSAPPFVRYLPANPGASTLNMAWPSDKLEEVLEPYDDFAVGHCQCRVVMQLVGKGCGKPTENCVIIGPMSRPFVERGLMRSADREEIIELKHEAERHGCVTWMMNERHDHRGNVSCSCCGCCCHGLRVVNQFSAPGLISSPHFVPERDAESCNLCGLCVEICPMGAWSKTDDSLVYDYRRCIGCGLCVGVCKKGALELKTSAAATKPEKDFNTLLLKSLPGYITTSFKLWLKRTIRV